jgi:ppGpp synthetase/RelA/SpoT-type nucleotidyltranferase
MQFQNYEREFFRFEKFAQTVKLILENAIEASDVPRPQSVQHRAKSPKSLKERLEESGKLDSEDIENERKDLAGVRIIFYTNTDVDRFLNSRLIFDNFELERDATKIHHPTRENKERRYRAIHYTVRLKEDRANLPEYSKFKGMRCEIQVQTILNHAWSETSHDIAYKNKPREGFGHKAMESIKNRLDRIMDKYLLPAGYEFQRVQQDYERLQQGKELFDQNILGALETAEDNNERHELLNSLKEQVLPNYDDVPAIYGDLIEPLISAVESARSTPTKPIETPFGELKGKTAADIARLVIEIFDMLRYVDIERTFDALCRLFRGEPDEQARKQIRDAVQHLAKYDLAIWEKVGPAVQSVLIDVVERMTAEDQQNVRSVIVAVWDAALASEITGTTWKASSVTLSSGSLPVSPEIKKIREKAISGLFNLFKRTASDAQRREVILALREATRPSSRAAFSNDLLNLTITDGTRIADFFADEADKLSYELRESMEHNYLFDYRRAREIAEDEKDHFGCGDVARSLMKSIIRLRDRINADQSYVRYKTLVGYETVFAEDWDDDERDFEKIEQFRSKESERFVGEITEDNEDEWFAFIERCAATKSDDLATFPIFEKFLDSLALRKPYTAQRLLMRANSNLLVFLTAVLHGLFQSDAPTTYRACIAGYLESGTHLSSLALHWRQSKPDMPEFIKAVLDKAIAVGDDIAVIQCLLFALEGTPANGVSANDEFFKPALGYLTSRKDARWVRGAWFADEPLPFFDAITAEEAKLLLQNLLEVPRIESHAEWILSQIARKHLPLVWDYFGQRLKSRGARDGEIRYKAIPHQFNGLEKELSKDAKPAVSTVRRWYEEDPELFQFLGGRLLSAAFPKFQAEISHELCELVTNGTGTDADFALAVMGNYRGEPATHEVLKRIVEKYPEDQSKLTGVSISFDNTGMVWGEFGFVDAIRQKKAAIEPWLTDPRPKIQAFAAKHIRDLDLRIADEQRRAEERKALRELEYHDDDDHKDGENKPDHS